MFEKTGARHTIERPVIVTLAGQDAKEAVVFIKIGERLSDLLNDPRAFIPIRTADGVVCIASKTNIVSISEVFMEEPKNNKRQSGSNEEEGARDQQEKSTDRDKTHAEEEFEPFRPKKRFDPYDILGLERGASIEEIRKAYKDRIKSVHPDTIAALDLDPDLQRAANLKAQKVNSAYQTILREIKASSTKAEDFV